jgi:hypothetical protein
MKAQEFYDEQLSNYNLLNLIDPATAKQAMQMMEEYHQAKLNLLTIPVVIVSDFCECDGVQDLHAMTGECRKCGKECTY